MPIKQLFQFACQAICYASQKVSDIYGNAEINIEYKTDKSPVTQADTASSDIIYEVLSKSGIPVICEEKSEVAYLTRKLWPKFWLVDPLDGTKEFINKNGEFTVNIALIEGNQPVLGLIAIPTQNLLYFGGKKLGSFKTNLSGISDYSFNEVAKLSNSISISERNNKIRILVSRSHPDDKTLEFLDKLRIKYPDMETVSAGSSLKFCRIAEGEAEVYMRFSPTMEWDTAAGQAIAEAAGATMVSLPGYKTFGYNKPILKNGGFLVTSLPDVF